MLGIIQGNWCFVKKKEPHKNPCRYRSGQITSCVADLSIGSIRVFEFHLPNVTVTVAWNVDGTDATCTTDLSSVLGKRAVTVTAIVTELDPDGTPIVPEVQQFDSTAIPLSITPVFIE